MRTKSDSADKVYSNRQTLRDCFMLRVLYTGKTKKKRKITFDDIFNVLNPIDN